ncbi:MAG: peptidylprolyl isomerase [Sphingomonadaceae bacterium]
MKKILAASAVLALPFCLPASAQEAPQVAPSPNEIVAQAAQEEWIAIAPEDLLVMSLAPDAEGNERRVVIQLMPPPFSQGWVSNIRTLARAGWYDGTAVYRVQDNYVTQWGDPADPDAGETPKPLPEGLKVMGEDEYVDSVTTGSEGDIVLWHPKPDILDNYSDSATFDDGWPIAIGISDGTRTLTRWPTHCYGMVGVARGMSPETGSGEALYTVIGHAPRHLDRNIALVGRVIEGIEHLSALPRGKGPLRFYLDASKRVPILSVRLASDLPEGERPAFEYLDTNGETFARYVDARANRRDPFFIVPAGGADICNLPVPLRRVEAAAGSD